MKRKILVVEDNIINRQIVVSILQNDYEVWEAENGKIALDILEKSVIDFKNPFSAVLLDIVMPVMDGYEVLEILKNNQALSQIPVIVMTADSTTGSEVKALSMGASDFIVKPCNPEIIRHRVYNMISMHENAAIVNATRIDALTGLYTRNAFLELVEEKVNSKESGYYVISSFDINNFKTINDQFGNKKGDEVLKKVSKVIKESINCEDFLFARFFSDTFAVFYPASCLNNNEFEKYYQIDININEVLVTVHLTIGRYIIDDLNISAQMMYDRANIAKQSIKGRYDAYLAYYDEAMGKQVELEQKITSEMKKALDNNEFKIWFQPQFNHSNKALIGAEALVRWIHPIDGLISPGVFIPVFEKNGFIYEFDKFVWEEACKVIRKWLDEENKSLPISVNISRVDLFKPDLVDTIINLVEKYEIPVGLLRLEVTESAFSTSPEHIVTVVNKLSSYGFIVEIDDFGSGYSSLNTLKDVPADILKLDMRFLEGKDNLVRGGNIIESIVRMANWIGMSIIAEGVETVEQADYLNSVGCNYIQGYLYAKPMPFNDFEKLIKENENEIEIEKLQTIANLDNDTFWNPSSIDTLIFNSYVGGACVFEYSCNRIEIIRANMEYAKILLGKDGIINDIIGLEFDDYLDEVDKIRIREILNDLIKSKKEVVDELKLNPFNKNSKTLYLRFNIRLIANVHNRYLFYSKVENITVEKEQMAKLKENDERMKIMNLASKKVIDDAPGGFIRLQVISPDDMQYVLLSRGFCEILGKNEHEIQEALAVSVFSGIHPDDIKLVKNALKEALKTNDVQKMRYRLLHKNGYYKLLSAYGKVTKENNNTYINMYYIDIFEENKVDEQRKELIDNMPCGAVIYQISDGNIKMLYANKYYQDLVGRNYGNKYEEVNVKKFIYQSEIPSLTKLISEVIKQGSKIECDLHVLHSDGHYIPFHITGNITKRENSMVIVYTTYTLIQESELKYKEMLPLALDTIMDSSSELSYIKDRNLCYVSCSTAFAKLVGLKDRRDIVGKNDYDLFDEKLANKYRQDDKKVLEKGKPIIDMIESIPSDNKFLRYANTSKYILKDSFNNVIGLYGSSRDITSDKESIEKLQLLVDTIPGCMAMYELNNLTGKMKIVYFSDGIVDMTGYTREEYEKMAKSDPMCLTYPEDLPRLNSSIEKFVNDGIPLDCIYRVKTKDDIYRWINVRGQTINRNDNRLLMNVVFFDIDKQKQNEMKLIASNNALDIASRNANISFWLYDINKKSISYDVFTNNSILGYNDELFDVPESIIIDNCVYPDDINEFRYMYKQINNGIDKAQCTVRLINKNTSKFEWQHIIYTLLDEKIFGIKCAIGFAINVDIEQNNRLNYEKELQLRKEIIKNSLYYYQLNLTTGIVEEYYSKYKNIKEMKVNAKIGVKLQNKLLEHIPLKYHELIKNTIFSEALLNNYLQGKKSAHLIYQKQVFDLGLRYVEVDVSVMERPNTNEIIAFLHGKDIDVERKDQMAIETIVNEEIDSVVILNVKSGLAHIVKSCIDFAGMKDHIDFDFNIFYSSLINNSVFDDDKKICSEYFSVNKLVDKLKKENILKIIYRINDDDVIYRKKTRFFYLDSNQEEIVIIRQDITDLYLEEQLQKQALEKAINLANEANAAKSSFISRMSHDMRTPLNAVLAYSDQEMLEGISEEKRTDYLNKIHKSGEYLLGIINDILDMSKLEQKKMVLNPTMYTLDEFLETINTIIGELSRSKNIDFKIKIESICSKVILVDKVRFNQIFINILSNAIKFTKNGGMVNLIIRDYKPRDGKFISKRFIIEDNGIGMSEEFLPHAFDSFSQEYHKDISENNQGTGLGLTIVKQIVGLMNGKISVESKLDVGTTFTIDLPLEEGNNNYNVINNYDQNFDILKGKHILLCEDNFINQEIVETLLKKKECICETASNGKIGCEMFENSSVGYYDAILMDIRMPLLNGIETTKYIKSLDRSDAITIPIIAMTADAFIEDEKIAKEAGMIAYISKPINPNTFYNVIKNNIKKQ